MNARAAAAGWSATVVTLFPEMFPGPLGCSLAGQALADGVWSLETVDIREFARDKHRVVDDTPFGGGPGMVLRADIIDAAIAAADVGPKGEGDPSRPFIYLTPRGKPLTQERVHQLARGKGLVVLCGRYEGIDERVVEAYGPEEISLGDFVLSGGDRADRRLRAAPARRDGQCRVAGGGEFRTGIVGISPLYETPELAGT